MEVVHIFYEHLVQFTVFCYILWTFGIVRGNLVYFSLFGILYQEKSGNPAVGEATFSRSVAKKTSDQPVDRAERGANYIGSKFRGKQRRRPYVYIHMHM
jgi:hypothetical protein